jgi:hypothetical protein
MISAEPPTRICSGRGRARRLVEGPKAHLQEGWVLANHILVSFHAAFISSVLALPSIEISKSEVLSSSSCGDRGLGALRGRDLPSSVAFHEMATS